MRIYGKRYVESTKTSVISVEGATFTILPVRTGLKLSFSLIFTPPLTFSLNLRLRKLLQDGPLKLTDNIKQKSFGNHNLVTTWWTTWLINWWNHWTNRKNPMGKPPLLSARTSERRLRSSSRRIAFFRNMPRRPAFWKNFNGIPKWVFQKLWIFGQFFTRDFEKKRANESNDFVLVFFESGVKHVELLRWVLGLVFDSQSTPERSNGFQLLSPFDSVLSNRRIGQRFSSTYSLAPSLHWEITSRPSCRVILELLSKSNKSSKSTDSQDT